MSRKAWLGRPTIQVMVQLNGLFNIQTDEIIHFTKNCSSRILDDAQAYSTQFGTLTQWIPHWTTDQDKDQHTISIQFPAHIAQGKQAYGVTKSQMDKNSCPVENVTSIFSVGAQHWGVFWFSILLGSMPQSQQLQIAFSKYPRLGPLTH